MPDKHFKLTRFAAIVALLGTAQLSSGQPALAQAGTASQGESGFATQQGVLDETPPESVSQPKTPPRVLNGQVSHSTTLPQPGQDGAQAQGANTAFIQEQDGDNATTTVDLRSLIDAVQRSKGKGVFTSLFSATIRTDGSGQTFTLQNRRPKLSPEYFRKLNYGVIGLSLISFLDGRQSVITGVYPTCPAALAGIAPGDIMYEANGYRFKPGDDQRTLWRVCAGKADTPIDVTVVRQGQPITFHLNRMNIEDIQDTRVRTQYEMLLSAFGAPPE